MRVDPAQGASRRALETYQDLMAAALRQQVEQLFVVGEGDVAFGEPAETERRNGLEELLAPLLVYEGVIVRQLQE